MYWKGKSKIIKIYKVEGNFIHAYNVDTKEEMKFDYRLFNKWVNKGSITKI